MKPRVVERKREKTTHIHTHTPFHGKRHLINLTYSPSLLTSNLSKPIAGQQQKLAKKVEEYGLSTWLPEGLTDLIRNGRRRVSFPRCTLVRIVH